MPTQFSIPTGPAKGQYQIDRFRGVDLASAPENIDKTRSPEAPNMLRDEVGKVRKRLGYYQALDLRSVTGISSTAVLHGVHKFKDMTAYHIGTKIVLRKSDGTAANFTDHNHTLADADSVSCEFGECTYIFDGTEMYSIMRDNSAQGEYYTVSPVSGGAPSATEIQAYVPIVRIGGQCGYGASFPGGTLYEKYNLMSKRWTESYSGNPSGDYCFDGNAGGGLPFIEHLQLVKAEVYKDTGNTDVNGAPIFDWVNVPVAKAIAPWNSSPGGPTYQIPNGKVKGDCAYLVKPNWGSLDSDTYCKTHWKVNFGENVDFEESPGTDNVKLTFEDSNRADERLKVCRSRHCIKYGVGGAPDRIFAGGSDDSPNTDYYSGYNEPTYFPDIGYTVLGSTRAKITGYGIYNKYLVTYMDSDTADDRNVIIRSGSLDDSGNAVFKSENMLSSPRPAGQAYIQADDPVFMTQKGLYAISSSDISGKEVTSSRSYFIDPKLTKETLSGVTGCVYNDFIVLAAGTRIYLLDQKQPVYQSNRPESRFQYEAYTLEGFPEIKYIWYCEKLRFATAIGKIFEFRDNVDSPAAFHDEPGDGTTKEISAYWDIPIFDGSVFFKNKTIRFISARIAAALATSIVIKAQVRGLWSHIYDSGYKACYFSWDYVDFSKLSFSADHTAHSLGKKTRLKKLDKVRFRLENSRENEGFGIYAFGLEYIEPGSNYKK